MISFNSSAKSDRNIQKDTYKENYYSTGSESLRAITEIIEL